MKVALFTDGIFPYVIGGMQKHSYYLVKHFARNKVHVDLYHTNQSSLDIDRLEVFTDEEKAYIRSFVVPFPRLDRFPGHYLRESYAYSSRLFDLFKENAEGVDFIYAKGFTAWKLLEEKQKGFSSPLVGVNFHGYEMFQPGASWKAALHRFLLRKPVRYCVERADYLFSYGGKITDIIRALGVPGKRILEIPTGIESSWLNEQPKTAGEPLQFLFVGRYERRKGIEELSVVLRELLPGYKFTFHFVGSIPGDRMIESGSVHYHGKIVDEASMKKIMQSCHVLVCPSHSEGMPNVIMEAMASGLAVVATDVGAVSLLVNSNTGWLIEKATPAQIKEGLVRMLQSPVEEIIRKGEHARELIRSKFLWENVIKETIQKISACADATR